MRTTLNLLLGTEHPHTMPERCITREHTLALHRALLHWLPTGTPPSIWGIGCVLHSARPPTIMSSRLHQTHSIAAAAALPLGQLWHSIRTQQTTQIHRDSNTSQCRPNKKAKPPPDSTKPALAQKPPQDGPRMPPPGPPPLAGKTQEADSPTFCQTSQPFTPGYAHSREQLAHRVSSALSRARARNKKNNMRGQISLTTLWPDITF
jgi:hypothetical protein